MTVGIDDDAVINNIIMTDQGSAPATPGAGKTRIFTKADGLYIIDDDGDVIGPYITGTSGFVQGAKVYHNTLQFISGGVPTRLLFNSETYDTDGIHNTGTNTGRLTAQTAGKYLIIGHFSISGSASGNIRQIAISFNGETFNERIATNTAPPIALGNNMHVSTIAEFNVGDFVTLMGYQDGVGALPINQNTFSPFFMMQRIG